MTQRSREIEQSAMRSQSFSTEFQHEIIGFKNPIDESSPKYARTRTISSSLHVSGALKDNLLSKMYEMEYSNKNWGEN